MTRGTKIVATIGPASTDLNVLTKMIRAGVDVFYIEDSVTPQQVSAVLEVKSTSVSVYDQTTPSAVSSKLARSVTYSTRWPRRRACSPPSRA